MRCYLAHPITDYGRTDRQKRAIAAIEARGWTVENPDQPLHQELYRQHGMEHFIELVKTCGSLAFVRFPGGMIGAGVAREIETALRIGLPVYDVSSGKAEHSGIMMPYPVLSVEQTRELIAALRHTGDAAQAAGMREALEAAKGYIERVPYGLELHNPRKSVMEQIEAALAAQPPAAPVETKGSGVGMIDNLSPEDLASWKDDGNCNAGHSSSAACEGVVWRRVNGEPFEYAIQQGPHGDEFVKLLNGTSLRRPITGVMQEASDIGQLYVVTNPKVGAVYVFNNHDSALACRRDQRLDSNHLWGCVVYSEWKNGQPERATLSRAEPQPTPDRKVIADAAEIIILRRLHEKKVEGYTLPMSWEIADAIVALSRPESK